MLATGDLSGLGRKLVEKVQKRRVPLAFDLPIYPRPPVKRSFRGPPETARVWMVGNSLALEGAPLSQFELACGLTELGVPVEVVCPVGGPLQELYAGAGIQVTVRPELACSPSVPAWYEADVKELAALLRRERPGVLLVNTIDSFAAVDAASLVGIPAIWNIRESESWRERLADRHPAIAARALAGFSYCDSVIFVAAASENSWGRFAKSNSTHLIHNAAHPSILRPHLPEPERENLRERLGASASDILVVSVGTLCARKGQIDLARAFSLLPKNLSSRLRIAFIGRSDRGYANQVESAFTNQTLARARFLGEIPHASRFAASADIVVSTSRYEGFPRALIEGTAGGAAIVATNVDGAAERLRNGVSAMLYPPGDFLDLASKLEVVSAVRVRTELVAGARAALIDNWTYDEMVKAYAALIHRSKSELVEATSTYRSDR